MSNYAKQKAKARQKAIDWQSRISEDWEYLAETYDTAPDYFYKLGKRYGLLEEFRENGII